MRYLNPKADLTFKKVFGEHPDLVASFLNALLPFDSPEERIEHVEYLPSELVPQTPLRKNSIVDVRCKDKRGRQFIVEMQMVWSSEFKQRVLFNASKAYVRQIAGGEDYELLFTAPLEHYDLLTAMPGISVIGHTCKASEGCYMTTRDGNTFELKAQGWQNFSSTTAAGESENKKAKEDR